MTSSAPISVFMSSPVISVSPDTSLQATHTLFVQRNISAVPVVDAQGRGLGVVSDTDLLRVGRLQPASLAGVTGLELPDEPVGEHMKRGVVTLGRSATMADAARLMVEQSIHRVFVEEDGAITGVVSTEDMLLAVRQQHISTAISELMSTPVATVSESTSLSDALSRLDRAHLSGLAVLGSSGLPIGVLTRTEALRAREKAADTKVESVMGYRLLTMEPTTPASRAAAHAYETRARRVFVVEGKSLLGVLTGLDFARMLIA